MLLTGLLNAIDHALYLVCHDDIVIMARTAEALSSVITPERGAGVGERTFLGPTAPLNKAEIEDIKDLETYRENRASHRPCAYPVRTWHTLVRWRNGCRAVHPEHDDLKTFIDGSRWVAERYAAYYRNDVIAALHDTMLDGSPTQHSEVTEGRVLLRRILRDFAPLAADQLPTSNA